MTASIDERLALDAVLEIMRLLSALNHELETTSARMSATLGVTAQQRMIVRIVGRFPGLSAGRLAEVLCVEPATVSVALARLEKRGIVTRERDPRDRRRSAVALTARGRELDRPAAGTVESAVAKVLESAAPGDVDAARAFLETLAAQLRGQASARVDERRRR